jgi:hypothetical protein
MVQGSADGGSVSHRGIALDRAGLVGTLTYLAVLTLAAASFAVVTSGWWVIALLALGFVLSTPRLPRGRHRRKL